MRAEAGSRTLDPFRTKEVLFRTELLRRDGRWRACPLIVENVVPFKVPRWYHRQSQHEESNPAPLLTRQGYRHGCWHGAGGGLPAKALTLGTSRAIHGKG